MLRSGSTGANFPVGLPESRRPRHRRNRIPGEWPVCPRPAARRARSVTTIRAPALQARAEAWPQRPLSEPVPAGPAPRGRHRHQPQPDHGHRRGGDPVPGFASDGQGAGCRSPECGASALVKKHALLMLVYSALLKTATCSAGTATRPPCPAAGRRAAQGRPKPAPAGFFSCLLRTLRGHPHIAPRLIRINNRPFNAPSCSASRPCPWGCSRPPRWFGLS